MAARGPAVARAGEVCNICQASVSRLANLSNDCQMLCPLLFRSSLVWELAQGLSEEAQGIQGANLNCASWLLPSTLSGTDRQVSSSQ